jgi:hypothetical protein
MPVTDGLLPGKPPEGQVSKSVKEIAKKYIHLANFNV